MLAKVSKHQNIRGMTRISRIIPILQWLPAYERESLRPDIMAGLTLAAFTVPEAIAYAELARLPAKTGLYAAIVPRFYICCLGHLVSSRLVPRQPCRFSWLPG